MHVLYYIDETTKPLALTSSLPNFQHISLTVRYYNNIEKKFAEHDFTDEHVTVHRRFIDRD